MSLQDQVASLRGSAVQKPNWDSYGAEPVPDDTITAAELVAERLEGIAFKGHRITVVVPTKNGAIGFSDDEDSVWVEVEADFTTYTPAG